MIPANFYLQCLEDRTLYADITTQFRTDFILHHNPQPLQLARLTLHRHVLQHPIHITPTEGNGDPRMVNDRTHSQIGRAHV